MQVLQVIKEIAKTLAPQFAFGIYEASDIESEIFLMCCEPAPGDGRSALEKYDPNRGPLQNFLMTHAKRRCINHVRNHLTRSDYPCETCYHTIGNITTHPGGEFCEAHLCWKRRNGAKASLMSPLDISSLNDENESNTREDGDTEQDTEINELLTIIDEQLDIELRADYLKMRSGTAVPKTRRLEVEEAIKTILAERGTDV